MALFERAEAKSFDEWTAEKDARIGEEAAKAAQLRYQTSQRRRLAWQAAQVAFAAWASRVDTLDRAGALLESLSSDADSHDAWRRLATALAFVGLQASARTAEGLSGVATALPPTSARPSVDASSVTPGAKPGDAAFKLFRRYSRRHFAFDKLSVPADMLLRFTAAERAGMEDDGDGKVLRAVRWSSAAAAGAGLAAAGTAASGPTPHTDSLLRNRLFDSACKAVWRAVEADATGQFSAAVSAGGLAAGRRLCARAGLGYLRDRRHKLEGQAAADAAKQAAEKRSEAQQNHEMWLQRRGEKGGAGGSGEARGRPEVRAGSAGGRLPRMDFSRGSSSGRGPVVAAAAPRSRSASGHRGRDVEGDRAAFSRWTAEKEDLAAAEDCLAVLTFPSLLDGEGSAKAGEGTAAASAAGPVAGEADRELWRHVGFACKAIHGSSLFDAWAEWACRGELFTRRQCSQLWSRLDPPPARGDRAHRKRAIQLLQAFAAEARERQAKAAQAAMEHPPATPNLQRAPHLEAPPTFVFGAAEVVAAARLGYRGSVGVAVPEGCPVLALGGTGVGAEVVLQWWVGDEGRDRGAGQPPYMCVLETCGVSGGADQITGVWTQVVTDPPEPLHILSSPPASAYIPLSAAAQGLGSAAAVPPAASPYTDTFASHHPPADRHRMRGCIRIVGLAPNTSYCYRLRAFSRAGASSYAFVVATTAPTPPAPPLLAHPSLTLPSLLDTADAAELAGASRPAAAVGSVRLCWAPAVCRRAGLLRLLRLFHLAVAQTAELQVPEGRTPAGAGEAADGSEAATSRASMPAYAADLSVLQRCICKEWGAYAFCSRSLAAPAHWSGAGEWRPHPHPSAGAAAPQPVPRSVMEVLLSMHKRASEGREGRPGDSPRLLSLGELLSLFAADAARLVPYAGGGGRSQLTVGSRGHDLLTMLRASRRPLSPRVEGPMKDSGTPAGGEVVMPSAVDTRFVLLRCSSDKYTAPEASGARSDGAAAGAEQVWQEVASGVRCFATVSGLSSGCPYLFRVQAVNREGIPSQLSFAAAHVTALPGVQRLRVQAAPRGAGPLLDSTGTGAAATASAGTGISSLPRIPGLTCASLTWSYAPPPAASSAGATDAAAASTTDGASVADPRVAVALQQLQGRKAGAGAGAAASLTVAGSPEQWFSLRRLWDRCVGALSMMEAATACSAGAASDAGAAGVFGGRLPASSAGQLLRADAMDVFQLRGLLADAGVMGESAGDSAARLAAEYLGEIPRDDDDAPTAVGGGSRAIDQAPSRGGVAPPSLAEALLGVSAPTAERVRWEGALAGLLHTSNDFASAAGRSGSAAAVPLQQGQVTFTALQQWWRGVGGVGEGVPSPLLYLVETALEEGDAGGARNRQWRLHGTVPECVLRLDDLCPNSTLRVRVTALTRQAASPPSAPLPVVTRPLAPFAPVPIATTCRSAALRWYAAEGGAASFRLQMRKVGSISQLRADSGSVASRGTATRTAAEAALRHMPAITAAAPGPGSSRRASTAAPQQLARSGSGGRSADGGESWTTVYSGQHTYALIPGLAGGTVYRFRVVAVGPTGLCSPASAETQVLTPRPAGLGASVGSAAVSLGTFSADRASEQFPVQVPCLHLRRPMERVLATGRLDVDAVETARADGVEAGCTPAGAAAASLTSGALCPDVVTGDTLVWTEEVWVSLPAATADALEFHYCSPGEGGSVSGHAQAALAASLIEASELHVSGGAAPPAKPGQRAVLLCRRTVAATVQLDTATGAAIAGSTGIQSPAAGTGTITTASDIAESVRLRGSELRPTDADYDSDEGEGAGYEEAREGRTGSDHLPPHLEAALERSLRRWGPDRRLTVSVEWSTVGPPLHLVRAYHEPVAAAATARFRLLPGAMVRRHTTALAACGVFRAEWEDEGGRWGALEEAAASLLQEQQD